MDVKEMAAMFPADDERYSPVPSGKDRVLDQRTTDGNVASLFRGPLVMKRVEPVGGFNTAVTVMAVFPNEREGAVVKYTDLQDMDGSEVLFKPASVGAPKGDGSFVVMAEPFGGYPQGAVLHFRPLTVNDHEWLGVGKQEDVASLATAWYDYDIRPVR